MRSENEIHAIVRTILDAQDHAASIEPITSLEPDFDLDAAYAVAGLVHKSKLSRGATPVGRKIGFTNSSLWTEYNVHAPIWAYVYDTTVTQLQKPSGTCSMHGLVEPKIEPEIVVRLGNSVDASMSIDDITASIDWIAHGFEIVQSHFPGWRFQAPDTVANSGLHGKLIVGPPQPVAEIGDDPVSTLTSFSLDLNCDGTHIESGKGENVLGNPIAAIMHLARLLDSENSLAAGEIITTGTITRAYSIAEGQSWQTTLSGIALPDLTVSISA